MGSPKDHFTRRVGDYDICSSLVVPENGRLHQEVVYSIPLDTSYPARVLDLGSGTGRCMRLVLDTFKESYVVGVDFSKRMADKSVKNLQGYEKRFELILGDFNHILFPGEFDVVISEVAIHNSITEKQRALFRKIRAHLDPGGVFINGDFIMGETPEEDRQYRESYEAFLRGNLSGDELDIWLKHALEEDMPSRLSDQTMWLEEAGFGRMKVIWRHQNLAVYRAVSAPYAQADGARPSSRT